MRSHSFHIRIFQFFFFYQSVSHRITEYINIIGALSSSLFTLEQIFPLCLFTLPLFLVNYTLDSKHKHTHTHTWRMKWRKNKIQSTKSLSCVCECVFFFWVGIKPWNWPHIYKFKNNSVVNGHTMKFITWCFVYKLWTYAHAQQTRYEKERQTDIGTKEDIRRVSERRLKEKKGIKPHF